MCFICKTSIEHKIKLATVNLKSCDSYVQCKSCFRKNKGNHTAGYWIMFNTGLNPRHSNFYGTQSLQIKMVSLEYITLIILGK